MKQICLIDDDPDDRELFCEAIQKVAPDFTCCSFPNAPDALAKLNSEGTELPVMIFLDVNMPGMSGWKCLSVLKKEAKLKDIPVMMYSTSSDPEDIKRAKDKGAVCFFSKPDDFSELKKCLALVVSRLYTRKWGELEQLSAYFNCSPMPQ